MTRISPKMAMDIIGRTGEKIIANLLINLGLNVQESINHFDSEKDFLVDGKTVEVKTEQPYVKKNAFTFRANQLRKCRGVDVLYFVSIPPKYDPTYKWGGWIFRAEPQNFKHYSYTTRFGVDMIAIPIDQEAMIPVCKMSDAEIAELCKYSQSSYSPK
jgi:hypothetical protein